MPFTLPALRWTREIRRVRLSFAVLHPSGLRRKNGFTPWDGWAENCNMITHSLWRTSSLCSAREGTVFGLGLVAGKVMRPLLSTAESIDLVARFALGMSKDVVCDLSFLFGL